MLRGIDQLGRLVGENGGDFRIEIHRFLRRISLAGGSRARCHLCGGAGDALIEALVGALDALEQLPVIEEEARGLIEMGGHRFHRRHAVL